jgi:pimeloyl-ACP methyl ester carboxylesterase
MLKYFKRLATTFFAAILMISTGIFTQSASAATDTTGTTVILVHGAWADGSSWSPIISILQKRGLKVVAVQLPRTSLANDAAVVSQAIEAQSGSVILVGHSYGGAVISQAGNSPKVAALVYVSAFAPNDGQSINDMISPFPKAAWQSGIVVNSAGYLSISTDTFVKSFAPDIPNNIATVLAATQGPLFAHCLDDKVTVAAWKSKPSWWVYGDKDQIIPPQLQQGEAHAIKAKLTVVPGGSHLTLVTHPKAVADVIIDAVNKVANP